MKKLMLINLLKRGLMLKKTFLVLLSAAVSILGATGSVSAQTCDAKDELLIGDHQPLSGASAAAGQALYNAVKLALKHYNEGTHPLNPTPCLHVGGKKYKLTDAVYDNRYTAEGGIAAAKRLVFEDGAKFVVGTMGSGPSVAASDAVFEANKIIFVTTGWSKNVISKDKPFTWRLNPTGSEFSEAFWQWATLETTGSKEALEGVYCFYGLDFEAGPPYITPEMERVYKAYNAEYPGVILDPLGLMVYDATVGVLEAIKMAQTLDTEKVNYVFGNFNWLLSTGVMSSWGGKEKIGRDAQIVQPVSVSQWKDGKIQVIGMPIVPVP